jgi:hypothetical protein
MFFADVNDLALSLRLAQSRRVPIRDRGHAPRPTADRP